MQCSNPLLAKSFFDPIKLKWSKPKILGSSRTLNSVDTTLFSFECAEHNLNKLVFDCNWDDPLTYHNNTHARHTQRLFWIPCGQCMECRLNYAREWTVRTTLESTLYPNNLFLTFTYNDQHLPPVPVDSPTERHPLDYVEFTKFIKRLRDHIERDFGIRFRYVYCGEYGDESLRPHYHMIMLNSPSLNQLGCKIYKRKPFPLYTSEYLERIWKNGFCPVAPATYEDIGYTCRYILKKFKGKKDDVDEFYKKLGVSPENRYQSRSPGIGAPWLLRNIHNVYDNNGCVVVPTSNGSYCCRPPAYFDSLYLQYGGDPLTLFQRTIDSDSRRDADLVSKLSQTDLDQFQIRAIEHDNFIHKCEMLYHRDITSHGK